MEIFPKLLSPFEPLPSSQALPIERLGNAPDGIFMEIYNNKNLETY